MGFTHNFSSVFFTNLVLVISLFLSKFSKSNKAAKKNKKTLYLSGVFRCSWETEISKTLMLFVHFSLCVLQESNL